MLLIHHENLDVEITKLGWCCRHCEKHNSCDLELNNSLQLCFNGSCDDTLSLLSGSQIDVQQYENAGCLSVNVANLKVDVNLVTHVPLCSDHEIAG